MNQFAFLEIPQHLPQPYALVTQLELTLGIKLQMCANPVKLKQIKMIQMTQIARIQRIILKDV